MVDPPPIASARAGAPLGVRVEALQKRFGRYAALNGVDLEVRPGELLALLGPSGSGKTTLLRMIAGLEFPDSGRVLFDADDVTWAAAAQRRVGFVFQQYALFQHMTVARNVAFGLDVRRGRNRVDRAERDRRVAALLSLVELGGMGARYPVQLSGGQRQRVALARALAVEPRVLLLDEPFGALDATVRKTLRRELRRLHDATGVTTIFVTHDQEEALDLADRVAVLNKGAVEQVGSPAEVQDAPVSAFVAGFVGEPNRIPGRVRAGVFEAAGVRLEAPGVADGPATAFVRPDQLTLTEAGGLRARIQRAVVSGAGGRLECEADAGPRLEIATSRATAAGLRSGEVVALQVLGGRVFADPAAPSA